MLETSFFLHNIAQSV